ncbi:MAG TPA: MarR family winged helix-turn-helix transcriptional regulator [Acidimicrobiales bacterium]|nr:MarR family winged helix-turn-helix transcriptional regulator [Acidimicrobiales bacterium]
MAAWTPPDTAASIPELMRLARGSYKRAIDAEYPARRIDDVPHPGGYVIAYLAEGGDAVADRMERLGIRKRQYNEVVDSLVLRGFVTRRIDPGSGAASFALTERGEQAAQAIIVASKQVDEELERRLSVDGVAALRRGLLALAEIKQSRPRP